MIVLTLTNSVTNSEAAMAFTVREKIINYEDADELSKFIDEDTLILLDISANGYFQNSFKGHINISDFVDYLIKSNMPKNIKNIFLIVSDIHPDFSLVSICCAVQSFFYKNGYDINIYSPASLKYKALILQDKGHIETYAIENKKLIFSDFISEKLKKVKDIEDNYAVFFADFFSTDKKIIFSGGSEEYLESLKTPEKLEKKYENVEEEKKETSALMSKSIFHQFNKSESDASIKGELIESFTEIILGEIDELMDIQDYETKNLLVNIIFDKDIELEKVIECVSEIRPVLGSRIGIICCCIFPDKWDEVCMSNYKSVMINGYVERSGCSVKDNETLYKKKCEWLKKYASSIFDKFIEESGIKNATLNEHENIKKREILMNISSDIKNVPFDSDSLREESDIIYEIIRSDSVKTKISDNITFSRTPSPERSTEEFNYKLKKSDKKWEMIYEIIKQTPKGKKDRNPEYMFQIINAILYKEEKKCSWRELPQWMPNSTKTRHYYYQWRSEKKLDKIKDIVFSGNIKGIESVRQSA